MSRILITGGFGFVGSNIALKGLQLGHEIVIMDNLCRSGSELNFNILKNSGEFKYYIKDTRVMNDVKYVIKEVKPDFIFHLAGQVAMTTSIIDPLNDFQTNVLGTLNILEAIREYSPYSTIIYSSSNKVYGDLEYLTYKESQTRYSCVEHPTGFSEELKLDFQSPYGCSKGAADLYLLDYHRMFDVQSIVFRHSTMYGGMQNANEDQGWIGWFVDQAKKTKIKSSHSFTISGDGKQVRDVLYVDDVINLYFRIITFSDKENLSGNAFNIGGGFDQSISLLELFNFLEKELDVKLNFVKKDWRKNDQKIFVSDNVKIERFLNWKPKNTFEQGIRNIL
jgi:CDP-paratose 2-epimerase